jgi:hypothetical protein
MHDQRRREERLRLGGEVRLLVDTPSGLVTTAGQVLDLSTGGCALRLHRPVDTKLVGRVNMAIAGEALWLPIITRWVRTDSRGWTVGCQFDRPTEEKQRAIRMLLLNRHKLIA